MQHVSQRSIGQRTLLGERLQDILNLMGQRGDAAHSDRVAGTFQGVGDALRDLYIVKLTFTGGQPLDGGREVGRLARQFPQETVQQFRIDILWQFQRHILGLRLPRPRFRAFLLGHQLRRDQQVDQGGRFRGWERLRPTDVFQAARQQRASRAVIECTQISERRKRPTRQESVLFGRQWIALVGQVLEVGLQTSADLSQSQQAD